MNKSRIFFTLTVMFITFEGIDYSGKSTQANLLAEILRRQGNNVLLLREPGGTAVSERIREILLDKQYPEMTQRAELLLFSAARTQLVSQVIRPALNSETIVICDRFYDSSTAYQGYGRGLNLPDVMALNSFATDGTRPDLTFLVDVTVDEIARRRKSAGLSADRMESAGREFFEKVRDGYRQIAQMERSRCVVVNGMQPVDAIHAQIWSTVQSRLSYSGA